jgi:hypothetical protein
MRNRKNHNNNEQGQAMVLLLLVIVGLFGALALAIDGGMIMYDRRSAQNAADAAALAGGYELANNPWNTTTLQDRIQTAGLTRAADNGYSEPDKTVTVEYPPAAGTFHYMGTDENIHHYVRVKITSPVNTSFVHFVFSGLIQNQVESVVHVIPPTRGNIFPGTGLVALAPHSCGMLYAGGNVKANLKGGGIFVNSDDSSCALNVQGGSNLIFSPSVTVVGGTSNDGGLIIPPGNLNSPSASSKVDWPPISLTPDKPDCSTAATISNTSHTGPDGFIYDHVMSPGSWSNILPNQNIWLQPGIYCFSNGFDANNNQHIGGDGVMLYITGPDPCRLTWNGGSIIKLSGYTADPYKGLFMYIDPGMNYTPVNAGPIKFNGNKDSYIIGTVYAPTCAVQMNGTGGNFYQGQVVGYDITLLGGAMINLDYVAANNYQPLSPSKVDLTQ